MLIILFRILDAYGHLSIRHPEKKNIFLMPRNTAPALLSSKLDIVEYWVEDASPVDPNSPPGYVERYIHSEIYKRYPEIQSVIHSHSLAILPYTITGISHSPRAKRTVSDAQSRCRFAPMRAHGRFSRFVLSIVPSRLPPMQYLFRSCYPGDRVPKFDIAEFYSEQDVRDLLIRNQRLGEHLSACFSPGREKSYNPVVLMRGHGFTVAGAGIEESVFRAIYTVENARVQTASLTLQLAAGTAQVKHGESLYFLDDTELLPATQMTQWSVMRPWNLWMKEVEVNGLYLNNA